jgi:hypothetical protein
MKYAFLLVLLFPAVANAQMSAAEAYARLQARIEARQENPPDPGAEELRQARLAENAATYDQRLQERADRAYERWQRLQSANRANYTQAQQCSAPSYGYGYGQRVFYVGTFPGSRGR